MNHLSSALLDHVETNTWHHSSKTSILNITDNHKVCFVTIKREGGDYVQSWEEFIRNDKHGWTHFPGKHMSGYSRETSEKSMNEMHTKWVDDHINHVILTILESA